MSPDTGGLLPGRSRKAVWAFDSRQVSVFEDRARPVVDIGKYVLDERASAHPAAILRRRQQSRRGGSPRPDGIGQRCNRPDLRRCLRGDIEHRILETDSWRVGMPQHPVVERRSTVDHNARSSDHVALTVDDDMDRSVAPDCWRCRRVEDCRLATQRSGLGIKYCAPGSLVPRQWSRVVHVHPRIHGDPISPTHLASYVRSSESQLDDLATRNDAVLVTEQFIERLLVGHLCRR